MEDKKIVKIIRVEITYDDGTSRYLIGEEAEQWKEVADKQMVFCQNHSYHFPKFNWKEINESKLL